MSKKHPGWILALDADYCARFFKQGFNALSLSRFVDGLPASRPDPKNPNNTLYFTDDLASRVSLRERERLEFDPRFLQPLNYIVLKQNVTVPRVVREGGFCGTQKEALFSTYYRKKGVGEDRLSDKMSIGWGGHSQKSTSLFDEKEVLLYLHSAAANIVQELWEECRFRVLDTRDAEIHPEQLTPVFKGFIYDMSDDVGRHHLALVWEVTIPEGVVLESKEGEHKLGGWCNRSELMAQKNERADLYENWSNIVIDQICLDGWDLLGSDNDWMSKENAAGAYQAAEAELAGLSAREQFIESLETMADLAGWSPRKIQATIAFMRSLTDEQIKVYMGTPSKDITISDHAIHFPVGSAFNFDNAPAEEPAIDLLASGQVTLGFDPAKPGAEQTAYGNQLLDNQARTADSLAELSAKIGPSA